MSTSHSLSIAVLGGGPDAEREVSLVSSQSVADALAMNPRFRVQRHVIDRLESLRQIPGDVLFPVLHGPWGEGGPLQDLLERDGRPFVGCRARAARLAMDKLATKLAASRIGVPTAPAGVLNLLDLGCPLDFPVVVKPIHEGSSVGVHFATDAASWLSAHEKARADREKHPNRIYMVEQAILGGRELTVGVLDGSALPIVEIVPKAAFYDYHAKYHSDDTKYVVGPDLPQQLVSTIQRHAEALCRELGVRHLTRVDFLIDRAGNPWLLEANTLPGFTGHSLFPMAAADTRLGPELGMTALCSRLVDLALRDESRK